MERKPRETGREAERERLKQMGMKQRLRLFGVMEKFL